jgi:hypothetical protein
MPSEYIIREKDFEPKVLIYLKKMYGNRVRLHPRGKLDVDVGVLKEGVKPASEGCKQPYEDFAILVEVKGTKKPPTDKNKKLKKRSFKKGQNKGSHLPVGIFQLMRRIKENDQKGMLFLPYHPDFEESLNEAQLILKRTELEIWFCNKTGKGLFWWRWEGSNK